jgi:hypothetical protein
MWKVVWIPADTRSRKMRERRGDDVVEGLIDPAPDWSTILTSGVISAKAGIQTTFHIRGVRGQHSLVIHGEA